MSEFTTPKHALSAFMANCVSAAEPSVHVMLLNAVSFTNIRGSNEDQEFVTTAEQVLGCTLPTVPNTVTSCPERMILWLGPDEWLLREFGAESVQQNLTEALTTVNCAINSQTGGLVALRISGPMAREVLCKGCTLDLSAKALNVDHCAQTNLSRAGVILRSLGDDEGFELFVRCSFVEYVALWLQRAGQEFGISFDVLPEQS